MSKYVFGLGKPRPTPSFKTILFNKAYGLIQFGLRSALCTNNKSNLLNEFNSCLLLLPKSVPISFFSLARSSIQSIQSIPEIPKTPKIPGNINSNEYKFCATYKGHIYEYEANKGSFFPSIPTNIKFALRTKGIYI